MPFGTDCRAYLNEQTKVSQLLFRLEQWTKYEQVLQRQAQAVTELRGEINRLQSQRSSLEKLLADGGQVQFVDNVLALVEGEVWAEVVSWDRDRVRLAGYAANMTELTIYVNDLERGVQWLYIHKPRGAEALHSCWMWKEVG